MAGLIKCDDRYIIPSTITHIGKTFNDNASVNYTDPQLKNEYGDVLPVNYEKFAQAYIAAQESGKIIDVMA